MVPFVLALATFAAAAPQRPQDPGPPPTERPETVVAAAYAAVDGDSAATVRQAWTERVRADPSDRAARLGLATIALRSYDFETAAHHLDAILAGDARSDAFTVAALVRRGHLARGRGNVAAADSFFSRARDAARERRETAFEAEALIWLANIRGRTHGFAEATALFDAAERLVPPHAARLDATLHCARAEQLAISRSPDAIAVATAGAGLAARAGDARLRAGCLSVVAAVLTEAGQVDSAIAVYDTVIRERRRTRDVAGLAGSLQWRGYLYRVIGRFGDAVRDLEEAVAHGRTAGNRSAEAWALGNLSHLWLAMGGTGEAAEYAARAARLFVEQGDRYGEAIARGSRAALLAIAGEVEAARAEFRTGLRIHEERMYPAGVIAHRIALAHLAMAEGDWAGAEGELEAARVTALEHRMPGIAKGLDYHFGTLALLRGHPAEAAAILRRAIEQIPPEQAGFRYLYSARLAEAYVGQGDLDRAEAELVAASAALDAWRADLDDRRLRLHSFQRTDDTSDPDLGIATVIAALVEDGRLRPAFHLAERRRARELLDRLLRARSLVEGDAAGAGAGAHDTGGAIEAAALTAAVPDDRTALLEFVTGRGGEPTTLFVATRDELTAHVLQPADDLVEAIRRFVALLEAGEMAAAPARTLYGALLEAALAGLPPTVDRLVVVPDGPLHALPFDATIMPDGTYLVERFTVSLAPSATIVARHWAGAPDTAGPVQLLAFAEPELDPGASTMADRTRGGAVAGSPPLESPDAVSSRPNLDDLPRLAASTREAKRAARHAAAATVLEGREASEAWLKRTPLRPFRIVHFATHALVDVAVATRTGLVLAPGDGEDGFVTAGELAALEFDAELVVLAACRTARGVPVRGEGVQGLTAAILGAGADAVVASRWAVGDAASARLMGDFYAWIAAGESAGDALRRAKLAALGRGEPPKDWAAYTLVGDASVAPPLHRAAVGPWSIAAGAVVMSLALLGLRTLRRRRLTGGA